METNNKIELREEFRAAGLSLGKEFRSGEVFKVLVKWLNTTRSWSGELELTEGTWLQLMCCAPSRSRCPKFWSNGIHGVYSGILEYTGEDGEDGETRGSREWVHYGQYTN